MSRKAPQQPLSVLFVAAESFPLAKVGGLADVAGSLPRALARLGLDVRLALPFYAGLEVRGQCDRLDSLIVDLAGRREKADIFLAWHPCGVPVYLVRNDTYFGREQIYGYPDDDERFVFFSKAVVTLLTDLGWLPDIVHCNDWHSALIPYYLRKGPHRQLFRLTATVFTVHNLAYQGPWTERTRQLAGLPNMAHNIMATGIIDADALNTVSPNHLAEILTPELGENMDGLLRRRRADLRGILNGVDYEEYSPKSDPRVPICFDVRSIAKKMKNKTVLQHWSRLRLSQGVPLIGVVSRLAAQKGIDLICEALEGILEMGGQLVLMGRGEAVLEEVIDACARRYPEAMAYHKRDDEQLARLIYAGADMLLAPSNFEPCGLAPLIAIRYGTVPIVRATGGLADTIIDYTADPQRGLGFSFRERSPTRLVDAVERAMAVYYRREEWRSLLRRLMEADFSWGRSSLEYLSLYRYGLEKIGRKVEAEGAILPLERLSPASAPQDREIVRRRAR